MKDPALRGLSLWGDGAGGASYLYLKDTFGKGFIGYCALLPKQY